MPSTYNFPMSPWPSTYAWPKTSTQHGVYYIDQNPVVTITPYQSTVDHYDVRDFYGNIVSSGTVGQGVASYTVTAPTGGWKPGYYRLYQYAATSDANFGTALGATNLTFLRHQDSRFPAPTNTPPGTALGTGNESKDLQTKAFLGMGTSRIIISNASAPTTGTDTLAIAQADAANSNTNYTVPSSSPFYDSARAANRQMWVAFPNLAIDSFYVGNGTSAWLAIKADNSVDGTTFKVRQDAGTSSGWKVTVTQNDGVTALETYDNLADFNAVQAAINGHSARIYAAFNVGPNGGMAVGVAGAIGNAFALGVAQVVNTMYPLGVTYYEGPANEPGSHAWVAQATKLFSQAVKGAQANAKVIGPTQVDLNASAVDQLLTAGVAPWVDVWGTHVYNSQNGGDFNEARNQMALLNKTFSNHGVSKPIWVTEGIYAQDPMFGVWQPRVSRIPLLMTMFWEQQGVPREHAVPWYDISHGYWNVPAWWQDADGTFTPWACMYRVLAEETFGMTHKSVMTFGSIGDRIFIGSIYAQPGNGTSVAMVMAQSPMVNANGGTGPSITVQVSGTVPATLTVSDGFGNLSTVTVTSGKATIPVADIPTYIRLPVGATITVVTCNDWPTNVPAWVNYASASKGVQPSGNPSAASVAALNDGKWITFYPPNNTYWDPYSGSQLTDASVYMAPANSLPDSVTLKWPGVTRVDRVILWCGNLCLDQSALTDFDIQTSMDGVTWTTQKTLTVTPPASREYDNDYTGHGCKFETYWDYQWIHDVKLPAPVACKYVRIYARHSSYGNQPDGTVYLNYLTGPAFPPAIVMQEIAVFCDDNAIPRYWFTPPFS